MSTFVHVYVGPEDKIEANVLDGLVRFIDKHGATVALIVPPSDWTQTIEVCDKAISAFMDLRGRAALKQLQAQRDSERMAILQEAVPESEEPPLCPCGQGYFGHDSRPLTDLPYGGRRRHIDDQQEAGHGQSDRQGGESADR